VLDPPPSKHERKLNALYHRCIRILLGISDQQHSFGQRWGDDLERCGAGCCESEEEEAELARSCGEDA